MPVPTAITDLSLLAASNYPAGSEALNTVDNYIRAHAAFIAQLRDRNDSVEDYGAVGDGATEDDAAFALAAASGSVVYLRDGATYVLTTGVAPVSGTRFVCHGIATIEFKTGADGFNSTDLTANKNALSRCAFFFDNKDNIGIEGVKFTTDGVEERLIYPVRVVDGCDTIGCRFERLEFSGFAVCNGAFLSLNTIGAGGYYVRDIVARSCGTALATWTGTPQITVVEIDNDMVSSTPSHPGYIENIRGYDLELTGAALAAYGQQTDVLNIAGISGTDRKGPVVHGVYGDNVGEIVDLFCSYAIISGVRGRNVYNYGVKLIHGAQHNDVSIDVIESVGVAAVHISGSASLAVDTQYNTVRAGTISILTSFGPVANPSAVVLFGDNSGGPATCLPKYNSVRVNNVHGDATGLDYVVRDGGADNANANFVEIDNFTGTYAIQFCDCVPANEVVRYRQNPRTRMTMSGNQVLTSTVAATVDFDTIITNTDGGADGANNRVRCVFPGPKLVTGQIRVSGLNADDEVIVRILKNGSQVAQSSHEATSSGTEHTFPVSCVIYIAEDECGKAASGLTIQAEVTSGGTITILNSATMSFFEVTDLG